jgi:mannose-6-phosphate isomerase-like protein (cupin superfamily)
MRYVTAFFLFVLLISRSTEAQVLPTSSGSCGISASGTMGCDWMSTINLRRTTDTRKTTDTALDDRSKLFVTRCILAPGAPLSPLVEGRDVLIVSMNNGELVNEKRSPQNHVNVSTGLVMLMPKEEPYLLRNVGKENLDLLVIDVRK